MMEERISAAESRGAAPGFLFQNFLNALQPRDSKKGSQRNSKSSIETGSSGSHAPSVSGATHDDCDKNTGGVDEATWRGSLTSAKKRFNQAWEQYSPTLKNKIQEHSPGPLRKLKALLELSEPQDFKCDEGEMEDVTEIGDDARDREGREGNVTSSPNNREDGVAKPSKPSSASSQVVGAHSELINSGYLLSLSENDETGELKGMDRHPPYIILQEADSNGNEIKDLGIHAEHLHRRKSPLTVQEWVDHLPTKDNMYEKDCENSPDSKDFDSPCVNEEFVFEEKKTLLAPRLSRDASVQSSSSLDSILDSRRPDPVEVLLNLGFGGVPGVDMNNCRIPKRFLVPSKCKGGDWNEFFKRELLQAQNFECASLGFRGLSGPSYRRPSAIVANIMEKLRERSASRHPVKNRFSSVARRILNEKIVLNKLVAPSQSVLSPDSRKFLESQGKISPEVPRRRIIFGQKSFAFGNDGEFIEVESSSSAVKGCDEKGAPSADVSGSVGNTEDEAVTPEKLPSPDIMLKLRRSSLQRQKKVEDEREPCDDDFPSENNTQSNPSKLNDARSSDDKRAKENKKIPVRFKSSTSLNIVLENESCRNPEEIKLEVEEEMKTLSQKIEKANSMELSSILIQMKELRTRLENSEAGTQKTDR